MTKFYSRLAMTVCLVLLLQLFLTLVVTDVSAVALASPNAGKPDAPGVKGRSALKHKVTVRNLPAAAGKGQTKESPPQRKVPSNPKPPRQQGINSLSLKPAKSGKNANSLAESAQSATEGNTPAGPTSTFYDPPSIGQLTTFNGTGFDNFAPPDTQLAIGPTKGIEMMNVEATVFDKLGTLSAPFSLGNFFGTNATYPAFSDPKVLYDAESGRFFAAGLIFDNCNPAPPPKGSGCTTNGNSEIDIAVSDTSDPAGGWSVQTVSQNSALQDQPKLGVSSDKVTMSWNNNGESGPYVYVVIDKAPLLTNTSASEYFQTYTDRFNIMPVHSLSPTNTAYAVYHNSGDNHVSVMATTGNPANNDVSISNTTLGIAGFSSPPLASQPNGSGGTGPTIDANDDRLGTAIWKNNVLWTAGGDSCQDPKDDTARACIRFIQISTSGGTSILQDTDLTLVGGDLYYPAVVLDSFNNLWAGFTASSVAKTTSNYSIGDMYPTATVAGIAGGVLPPTVPGLYYQNGTGVYNCTFCKNNDGSRRPRFGDYSGAAVDPSKPNDIWVAEEFGSTSATDTDQWGVAIGRFTFGPVVSSVVPNSVPELSSCSQPVTINGANFDGGVTSVKFGAVNAPSFNVVNANQLTTFAPAQSHGTVDVTVTTTAGGDSTTRSADLFTYQADNTAPTTGATVAPGPNGSGWNNTSVTVSLSASDLPSCGSGVKSITYSVSGAQTVSQTTVNGASASFGLSNEGVSTVSFYATDNAGNVESTETKIVQIDKTDPLVNCAASDGLWHASDVNIACTASDPPPGSGLANPATDASFNLSTNVASGTETNNACTGTRDVYDVADNFTTAGPVCGNMVDKKPPSITITTPPAGSPYLLNQPVPANYGCTDGGSGVNTCAGPVANGSNIDTAAVGNKTFTVNATDNVANASTLTMPYQVTYKICLQYDPTKGVPSGATMSIRIQICDFNNVNVSSKSITVTAVSLLPSGTLSSNSNPGNIFVLSNGVYVYNLSTKLLSAGSYTMQFTVTGDPIIHSVPFLLKK